MAVKKKTARKPAKKTKPPAAAEKLDVKWCPHGINEKFCVSCKGAPKRGKKKKVS
jgi:hypothetical protein